MTDRVAENYLRLYLERQPVRRFSKGEIIVFQGEAPRTAYIVKSGYVKAYNLSVAGDEKPVAFYGDRSVFPRTWIYGQAASSVYYYEAFTDNVELYAVDRDAFVTFLRKRPALLYDEFQQVLADQLGASLRLNALQHSRASDKLLYTLHYLALTHGVSEAGSRVLVPLALTHQDFANLTGLTRETAATELHKLKKTQVISYGKNKPYLIDLARLHKVLNDQFLQELPRVT